MRLPHAALAAEQAQQTAASAWQGIRITKDVSDDDVYQFRFVPCAVEWYMGNQAVPKHALGTYLDIVNGSWGCHCCGWAQPHAQAMQGAKAAAGDRAVGEC